MILSSLMLLNFLIGVCLSSCGCNGTNEVYVVGKQKLGLLTGWYKFDANTSSFVLDPPLVLKDPSLDIHQSKVEYFLKEGRGRNWFIRQKLRRGKKTFGQLTKHGKRINVTCPRSTCQCERVAVKGGPNYIRGNYYRIDIFEEEMVKQKERYKNISESHFTNNSTIIDLSSDRMIITHELTRISLKKMSLCSRRQKRKGPTLSNILNREKSQNVVYTEKYEEKGAGRTRNEIYIREDKLFNLTRAPLEDFWWILLGDMVYATSKERRPCLDNLPLENQWNVIVKDGVFDNNTDMTVECFIQPDL